MDHVSPHPFPTHNMAHLPSPLQIRNEPHPAQYQIIPPHDTIYYNTPLAINHNPHPNGMNCFAAMTCLACTIPITTAFLGGALFFLSFRYSAEKDLLTTGGYVCIAAFVASCIIFAAYFCLRKKQPGDQVAAMNGMLCCSTCSEAANALASCGILCEICTN